MCLFSFQGFLITIRGRSVLPPPLLLTPTLLSEGNRTPPPPPRHPTNHSNDLCTFRLFHSTGPFPLGYFISVILPPSLPLPLPRSLCLPPPVCLSHIVLSSYPLKCSNSCTFLLLCELSWFDCTQFDSVRFDQLGSFPGLSSLIWCTSFSSLPV